MPAVRMPSLDRLDDGMYVLVDARELGLLLGKRAFAAGIEPVELTVIFGDELGDQLGLHEVGLEAGEDARFQHVAANGEAVVAGTAIARGRAAVMLVADLGETAAADAALDEVRQEIEGTTCPFRADAGMVVCQLLAHVALACLDGLPERVVDDAQRRHLLGDPLRGWVGPGLALAGRRVFDEALPVPDQLADIELVVEDAGAAAPVAIDRGRTPALAVRAGHALRVELDRDSAR